MRNITTTLCLTFAVLIGITGCVQTKTGYVSNVRLLNGGTYSGSVLNNKFNGQGSITFDAQHKFAGHKYVGEFRGGKPNGQGSQTFVAPNKSAGLEYVGEFRDGKRHGNGSYAFVAPHRRSGTKYVGEFRDGMPNGQGTSTHEAPSKIAGEKYVGEWKNGLKHGQGTETLEAPNKRAGFEYVGEFRDGKRNGQGTATNASGIVVKGIWVNGTIQNQQKSESPWFALKNKPDCNVWNNNPLPGETITWSGPCKNGKAHGNGISLDRWKFKGKLFEQKYKGEYKDGKFNGQGTYFSESGDNYVGGWKNGLRHGQGTKTFADGGKYVGKFKDGKFNGQGTYSSADGMKYVGEFKSHKFNGQGTLTLPNGKVSEGVWENGKFLNAKKVSPNQIAKAKPKLKPKRKSGSSGSGFFISKLGHILTNQHVVNKCRRVTVGDTGKTQILATVLETDKRNDLALLRISSTKMASAETKSLITKLGIAVVPLATQGLLRSKDVELGEKVMVAGYPFGDIFSNSIKVNTGIISANRGFGDDTGQFQLDAAVQPGNSGGPIYDEYGNIIGVVVAQLNKLKFAKNTGAIPENVNFGIKASTVRQFLNASGLPTKYSKRSKAMSTRDLAKIAKNQTVMVVCHR